MKKILLVILVIFVAAGALAGAGFAGYHLGYARNSMFSQGKADTVFGHKDRFFSPNDMPGYGYHQNDRGFRQGFGPGGFSRMDRGGGFGHFGPISFLFRIALLGLIVWLAYRLFKGNGWQLSLTRQSATPPATNRWRRTKPKTIQRRRSNGFSRSSIG